MRHGFKIFHINRMGKTLEDLEFKAKNFGPGPGRYESTGLKTVSSMKFGTGNRPSPDGGKETRLKPGPGNYSIDQSKVKTSPPKYGFGTADRDGNMRSSAPGPG